MRFLVLSIILSFATINVNAQELVDITFRTVDSANREVPSRVKLVQGNESYLPTGEYDYRKWFLVDGEKTVSIPKGTYSVQASKGIEWFDVEMDVTVQEDGQIVELTLERWTDMNDEGWWSGDMHIHRPLEVIEELVQIEGINVAPVLTFWNHTSMFGDNPVPRNKVKKVASNQYYSLLNEEHERQDGAILLYNLEEMLDVKNFEAWYPDAIDLMMDAHKQNAHVEIEKPFWNDYPLWLAIGEPHSIGVVCNHFQAEQVMNNPAWGRPRAEFYPDEPYGLALYVMDLYYKALNCGFRAAATGGGASGVLDNPIGQNRTYVNLGGRFSYNRWFDELRKGNSVATNGPMLFVSANGKNPGTEFDPDDTIELKLKAISKHGIKRVEWIVDGVVLEGRQFSSPPKEVELNTNVEAKHYFWIAARVFEDSEPEVVRFAQSSPFYINNGDPSKRYQTDVEFFLHWLDKRIAESQDESLIPIATEREKRVYNLKRAKAVFIDKMTSDYLSGDTVFYYGDDEEEN